VRIPLGFVKFHFDIPLGFVNFHTVIPLGFIKFLFVMLGGLSNNYYFCSKKLETLGVCI
jgi:hypothetical protein